MNILTRLTCAFALVTAAAASHATGVVNVDIYSGFVPSGGGAPYSGLVGSFTSPDVQFATSTGYNWHPFFELDFGADITGCINVPTTGSYLFTLDSSDGSLLFIDSVLVINNGGLHGPNPVSGTAGLTAGQHSFEVQFWRAFGGPSGVDLSLPQGVSYANCPEGGSTMLLLGSGILLVGTLKRRSLA